jgi:two-component system NarL family response regulator
MQTLLVDDHPLVHQILPALLRKAIGDHVMVQSAENLEEAIDCVRRNSQLELILLDLGLPGCSGIEALERIRERCPRAKIVVLSAAEDAESIQAAFRAGVEGYIPKTSPPPTIIDALRLVCDGGTYVPPQALDLSERGTAPTFSRRQREVLHLMLRGLSNRDIAKRMRIAENTVKHHVGIVYETLGAASRAEAITVALRRGFKATP